MIRFFNSVVQCFGLLGVFRYIMDQAAVNAINQMIVVLREACQSGGYLQEADQQKLITDVSSKMWVKVVGAPDVDPSGFIGRLAWFYRKFCPEGARDCLSYASVPVASTYNYFTGNRETQQAALRDKTRQIAVRGLWSFLIPAGLAVLSACLLIREVEYVQVPGDSDYYDDAPAASERLVKRILIGGGSISFSIPHNPILLITLQILVGVTVFQLVSGLVLILAYNPGRRTP